MQASDLGPTDRFPISQLFIFLPLPRERARMPPLLPSPASAPQQHPDGPDSALSSQPVRGGIGVRILDPEALADVPVAAGTCSERTCRPRKMSYLRRHSEARHRSTVRDRRRTRQ